MSWDERFLKLAFEVSTWSKDPSTKVGCLIARDKRIISLGFNGFPHGTSDDAELYKNRDRKIRRVIHAEKNAILFAQRDLAGSTIYVTHAPCAQCVAMVIQSGISRIVCPNPWGNSSYMERWRDDVLETEAMCRESHVRLEYV